MELRLIIMALVCLCIAQLAFATEDNYSSVSAQEEQRFVNLTKELRCAECQNQTVHESNSNLAVEMRAQISSMINAGDSDAAIREYLTYRYGEYILFNPPWRMDTWLLWLGPLFMFIGVVFLFFRWFKVSQVSA